MMERNGNGLHNGTRDAARQLVMHARTLVQLELELARLEVARKARSAAVGVGLGAGAGVFAAIALLLAVGAATAALTLVVPVWAALLIMMGVLLLLAAIAGIASFGLLKNSAPPVPDQAIEEAKRTKEAVQQV